ncbi:pro-adrenomedullin isoform X2 [Tachyglossus aculeatus]|uniref:pro-adrenomedullin isoform X2 n=1 Tax=Tachyglossus aculeatus TaxID=9261 RepID=UPI0018F73F4E|nr:pro-adrenomedullin isoform X2 [Tachyglossus aculeatus]
MRLMPMALVYLGALSFLAVDSAPLDVASEFRKKWNKWALNRRKRELRGATSPSVGAMGEAAAARPLETFVRPLDVKGSGPGPQSRSPDASRIRVKRYRQSMNGFPHFQGLRLGCRFGTCTVQKLAHQIYQLTDKDKDDTAPANKISPQGYGRRRRRRSARAPVQQHRLQEPLQEELQLQEERLQLQEPLQEKLHLKEPLREKLQLQEERLQLQEPLQEKLQLLEPLQEKLHQKEPLRERLQLQEPLQETLQLQEERLELQEPLQEKSQLQEPLQEKLQLQEPLQEKLQLQEPLQERLHQQEPLQERLQLQEGRLQQQEPLQEKLHLNEPLQERLQLKEERQQLQESLQERLRLQERLQGTVPSPMSLRLRGDLGGGGGPQTLAEA